MSDASAANKQDVIQDLIHLTPLYAAVTIHSGIGAGLRADHLQFDIHCLQCQKETTFKTNRKTVYSNGYPSSLFQAGLIDLELFCLRCGLYYVFYFRYDGETISKIGQYPSAADLQQGDISKYRPLLKGGYYQELSRAIGLISHGVGIGSLVYLRRIFEKLIFDHYERVRLQTGEIPGFETMRMDDKIDAIRSELPPALVKNKAAYKILSAGIHALDEDTCKLFFPVLKAAIVQILEQDLHQRETERRDKELSDEIQRIAGSLSASK